MLAAILVFPAAIAWAGPDLFVISGQEYEYKDVIFKYDLPNTTVVQNDYFSIQVPKGWSLYSARPDGQYAANLSVSPTRALNKQENYLSIHVKRHPSRKSLLDRRAELARYPIQGDKLFFVNWQGHRWLVHEHSRPMREKEDGVAWTAWTTAGKREVVLVAGTPKRSASQFEPQMRAIMQTISFREP
jgi:2-succinyl-5-enolpyruvyl-6-hydroxy-3-cyclohexene-1-carboxylate synthase